MTNSENVGDNTEIGVIRSESCKWDNYTEIVTLYVDQDNSGHTTYKVILWGDSGNYEKDSFETTDYHKAVEFYVELAFGTYL